jgi:NitT/TauT family transport system substrate-binding protein
VYDLEQHLKIMDRSHGASKVDDWMTQISEFLKGVGTIQQVQPASEYVTDRYMKMIAQDPKLKAFAESAD